MSILLTTDEIEILTQYKQPAKQLETLHRQGFFRARIGRAGSVVLERAHYESACAGEATQARKPQIRKPSVRSLH
jgi:hypothetical protein